MSLELTLIKTWCPRTGGIHERVHVGGPLPFEVVRLHSLIPFPFPSLALYWRDFDLATKL